MGTFGVLLIIAGLGGIGYGFTMKITVKVPGMEAALPGSNGEVINLDLLMQREAFIIIAGIAILLGALCLIAEQVINAIKSPQAATVGGAADPDLKKPDNNLSFVLVAIAVIIALAWIIYPAITKPPTH